MANIEDIKKRLRALFSKTTTNGASEAEAATALSMAKRLASEWNLSEADYAHQTSPDPIVQAFLKPRAAPPNWEMRLGKIMEILFGVKAYVNVSFPNGVEKETLVLVGLQRDTLVATEAYALLKAEILALGKTYQDSNQCSRTQRFRYCDGVVNRLISRVKDAQFADQQEADERCRSLVVSKASAAQAWCDDNLHLKKSKTRTLTDDHFFAGVVDGDKVSLGFKDQIETPKRPNALLEDN